MNSTDRPTYVLRLRPEPGVDPLRALRAALKVLLRRFGLRCVEVREFHFPDVGKIRGGT